MNLLRPILASTLTLLYFSDASWAANCASPISTALTASCDVSAGGLTVDQSGSVTLTPASNSTGAVNNSLTAISAISVSGTLQANASGYTGSAGFFNKTGAQVDTFTVTSTGSLINYGGMYWKAGLVNWGTINTLNNSGVIRGDQAAAGTNLNFGVYNYGTIDTLNNYGSISGTYGVYYNYLGSPVAESLIYNAADATISGIGYGIAMIGSAGVPLSVAELRNAGSISASGSSSGAIYLNNSSIGILTNTGTLAAAANGAEVILSTNSSISTFNNAQSGVRYAGTLPTYYNMIVTNSSYGSLVSTNSASSSTTFGVSALSTGSLNRNFLGVVSGLTATQLINANQTVTYANGGVVTTWQLTDANSDNSWDLIFTSQTGAGPDAGNTAAAMRVNANALRSVSDRRLNSLALMTSYDCQTFDKHGACVSFQARGSASDRLNEGAGVLTAAYRMTDALRAGAFIDYRAGERDTAGIAFSNDLPTVGAFAAVRQNPDGSGFQGKLIGAAQRSKATITRPGDANLNTEAGSGRARLDAYLVSGELGWGFAVANASVATPYAGLRYTDATRSAYSEAASGSVDYPISYDAFRQRLTTATLGLRLNGMLTDRIGYQVGSGLEHDLREQTGAYSGSSGITDLETFALKMDGPNKRMRGVGTLGAFYEVEKNQRLLANIGVRNQPYSNQTTVSALAGYQAGF